MTGPSDGTSLDRAVAYLYYADRLYQLPLGVIGVAIGVVLLPDLSRVVVLSNSTNPYSVVAVQFARRGAAALNIALDVADASSVGNLDTEFQAAIQKRPDAALVIADKCSDLRDGIALAANAIDSGNARRTLELLINASAAHV